MSETKKRFSSIFKSKDSSKTSGSNVPAKPTTHAVDDGEPRNRRMLFTQLSESEKSQRRSTMGTTSLQPTPLASNVTTTGTTQIPSSKSVLFQSQSTTTPQPAPELETPFAKMVRQTTSGTLRGGPSTDTVDQSQTGRKQLSLSAEEKKARRKSLLAPVQNLFGLGAGQGATSTPQIAETKTEPNAPQIPESDSQDKTRKKKKTNDPHTSASVDDTQAKIQKEKQKRLQKELDRIAKENLKHEKARQTRLLEVLQQTLELGDDRANLPVPGIRTAFVPTMRPPLSTAAD